MRHSNCLHFWLALAILALLRVGWLGGLPSHIVTWFLNYGWNMTIAFNLVLCGVVQLLIYLLLLDSHPCSIWTGLRNPLLRFPSMHPLYVQASWTTLPDLLGVFYFCFWILVFGPLVWRGSGGLFLVHPPLGWQFLQNYWIGNLVTAVNVLGSLSLSSVSTVLWRRRSLWLFSLLSDGLTLTAVFPHFLWGGENKIEVI